MNWTTFTNRSSWPEIEHADSNLTQHDNARKFPDYNGGKGQMLLSPRAKGTGQPLLRERNEVHQLKIPAYAKCQFFFRSIQLYEDQKLLALPAKF